MMSVKPFLVATLPSYLLIVGMVLSAMGTYALSQAVFNNPFPTQNPGIPGFVFFGLFTVSILMEVGVYSRLMDRLDLRDVRVPLPRHWRSVILDMVTWSRAHETVGASLVIGGIVTTTALGEAIIFAMQAMHASPLEFIAVGLGGLFIAFFALSVGQVLIRSAICPFGTLSDEELAELLAALPSLGRDSIEYMKHEKTFEPSPSTRKAAYFLFTASLSSLGASLAATYWNLASVGLTLACLGSVASILAIILIGFPVFGTKVSSLSRRLNRRIKEREGD